MPFHEGQFDDDDEEEDEEEEDEEEKDDDDDHEEEEEDFNDSLTREQLPIVFFARPLLQRGTSACRRLHIGGDGVGHGDRLEICHKHHKWVLV